MVRCGGLAECVILITFALEMEHIVSIDKEQVNELPPIEFSGQIYVVDTLSMVNAAVQHLRKQPIVGFDTETRPSFRRGESHKPALVQLATADECFLFRINKLHGLPAKLNDYLEDEACRKVGLSTNDDFNQLRRFGPIQPAGFTELQQLVGDYGITDLSLQKIYAILFGRKISKGQRLTNWEADELTASQRQYAAIDAWACVQIYYHLLSGAFVARQSPYYHIKQDVQAP